MRGRCSSIVNRVVRSTRVPVAKLPSPRMRSPSQCPGTARSVASAGRWLIIISGEIKVLPRPRVRARGTRNTRPSGAKARCQLAAKRSSSLDEQGLIVSCVADTHRPIVRESIGKRRAICSGLHALAHRRSCRGPCRRPFQDTAGPGTGAPLGATATPASLSPPHNCAMPRCARASPDSGDEPIARRAIVPSSRDTQGPRFGWRRRGAIPARSLMLPGRARERISCME